MYSRSIERAYDAAEARSARGQDARLRRAYFALDDLRHGEAALDPPRSRTRATRSWRARLDAVDDAIFALQEAMRRPDGQATVDRRYRLMRRAIPG